MDLLPEGAAGPGDEESPSRIHAVGLGRVPDRSASPEYSEYTPASLTGQISEPLPATSVLYDLSTQEEDSTAFDDTRLDLLCSEIAMKAYYARSDKVHVGDTISAGFSAKIVEMWTEVKPIAILAWCESKEAIIVGYRGTSDILEGLIDAEAVPAAPPDRVDSKGTRFADLTPEFEIHHGMWVSSGLHQFLLKSLPKAIRSGAGSNKFPHPKAIIFTGHSLGGALAKLSRMFFEIDRPKFLGIEHAYAVTFGAPLCFMRRNTYGRPKRTLGPMLTKISKDIRNHVYGWDLASRIFGENVPNANYDDFRAKACEYSVVKADNEKEQTNQLIGLCLLLVQAKVEQHVWLYLLPLTTMYPSPVSESDLERMFGPDWVGPLLATVLICHNDVPAVREALSLLPLGLAKIDFRNVVMSNYVQSMVPVGSYVFCDPEKSRYEEDKFTFYTNEEARSHLSMPVVDNPIRYSLAHHFLTGYVAAMHEYATGSVQEGGHALRWKMNDWHVQAIQHPELKCPVGVAVERDRIWVADSNSDSVKVFGRNSTVGDLLVLSIGNREGSENGQFHGPAGVVVDRDGNILVCDAFNNRVQLLSSFDGSVIRTLGKGSNRTLDVPWGICVDGEGNVYVAERNNRVVVFRKDGQSGRVLGSVGTGEGQFKFPRGVAIDREGNVIVADTGNSRVQVLSKDGSFLRFIGKGEGAEPGYFNQPHGLHVDNGGNLLVADTHNHRIQVFSSKGEYLRSIGYGKGDGPGQFNLPWDVMSNTEGVIAVADGGNKRIMLFRPRALEIASVGVLVEGIDLVRLNESGLFMM